VWERRKKKETKNKSKDRFTGRVHTIDEPTSVLLVRNKNHTKTKEEKRERENKEAS